MKIPVTFKLSQPITKETELFLKDHVSRFTFDWISKEISFDDDELALAFSLKFGLTRKKTKLEQMLENEKN